MLKPAGPKRDMVMYKASSGADTEFTWGLDLVYVLRLDAQTETWWCPTAQALEEAICDLQGPLPHGVRYMRIWGEKKDEASNDADMRIRGIHELIAWDSKEW